MPWPKEVLMASFGWVFGQAVATATADDGPKWPKSAGRSQRKHWIFSREAAWKNTKTIFKEKASSHDETLGA